ncbi:protoporphyrinogen oxidase [Gemella sp. GH3]|uniref:protoporphyrinogen oxidase n=1 Tax=unclassified Gemella TaxID=2624949 RepID=UPI0015D03EF0|nr:MULTISPECIES: protoporphyrinogen oxidase [unclassified Gemella]MBF0713587.1 protoporphyrinogen oxidase [Gemella sp. GH3.1]NYS50539.1 protoporphyrinogen oxidase [Gemella sp. GH3]
MKNIAIIGGGISGLSVAYFLDKLATVRSKKVNINLIEKNSEFAHDKISKFQYGQEIYDNGWHNSISGNSSLFQVMLELGLYKYLIKSKSTSKVLYTNSGLKDFPEKILFGYPLDKGKLLSNDILSLKEKISVLVKLHKNNKLYSINTSTVEDFFFSKINSNVYEKIIEPLLTSYYGSDISKQSFSLLMPELAFATIQNSDVENVVTEMYKNKIEDNILSGSEYRLKFTLSSFLENLESYFSNNVFVDLSKEVQKIEKKGNKYLLTIEGKKYHYDYVIVAVKHTEFLKWFEDDVRLQRYYNGIKFVSNIVATIIYDRENLQLNPDIGEIIFDKNLDKYITNIEYTSNKWPEIKSQNIHMVRAYIKRQNKVNELLKKTDTEIVSIIREELEDIYGKIQVEEIYITRVENNYMYADIKYSKYIHEIDEYLLKKYKNMYFIGNSKKSINFEQTILEAKEVAHRIVENII